MVFHEEYTHRKHILVIGQSDKDRKKYIDEIITKSDKAIYRFKRGITSFRDYIKQVRKIFPFIPLDWNIQNPKKWTLNQIWDFHLDWTNNTSNVLIVLEEFQKIEEEWKIAIVKDYFTTSYYQEKANKSNLNFQLIITLPEESELIEKVAFEFGLNENEKRDSNQIIKGKLKIINLDW